MAGRHPALPPPRLSARSRESAFSWCRAGWCAAARQFARKGCSHPLARHFPPRVLFGVGAMKTAFNVVFTMALILGLVSTVAANAPLVSAPQVLTSN